jgi:release factor glutamine methyltransferase
VNGLPAHELDRLRAVTVDEVELRLLVDRRLAGEPLQYLEGSAAFGPFDLVVDSRVLVPRPETEGLWEIARGLVDDPKLIVDLCTGSGALAIALQSSFPSARVIGTDLSEPAIELARINGAALAPSVEWFHGDLFDALDAELTGRVDLLVSNPPYVAASEWLRLPADVRHEPHMALVAGPTGLEVLRRIATESSAWLNRGAAVVCEIGEDQGPAVREMFSSFSWCEIRPDLAGKDRYLVAGT